MADEKKIKITFTEDFIFENEGRMRGLKFEKGKTYELDEPFAQRFLRRNVAQEADAKVTAISKPEKALGGVKA